MLLKRQPVRLITAVLGVAFAGILILMQLGFQAALFNSSVSIVERFDTDLILLGRQSVSLTSLTSFPEARLAQLAGHPAVETADPMRWRYVRWRLQGSPEARLAIAIGIYPFQTPFADREIQAQQHLLDQPGRILYDRLSRPEFGPVQNNFQAGRDVIAFVGDERLRVAGLVNLGPSFGYDASFITSTTTFEDIFADDSRSIELGLIKLKRGSSLQQALKEMRPLLPADTSLISKKQLIDNEKSYWNTSKPIGFAFAFCALMSLAVGGMMVYQLLYTDVGHHLPSYAILLSIGYRRSSLERIIFEQGLILCLLGFPIALLSSHFLHIFVRNYTSLPMRMSTDVTLTTLLLIVAMCSTSALLAMNKLKDADPSELFN
ncbi:FtsX-like permease family protein [Vulcanococcus limneticus Candia 3F8]|nr:FtsX-like permease family protein [Vulcanococcus limneticus MW73D5]MCP9894836.1 FtsX-like permease family protein [Vulcanococcus limneticus Candia 3F8]MCP9898315.1 FtsX-like permease family protein [Vulcanococcus limneticus Candia 3B3]